LRYGRSKPGGHLAKNEVCQLTVIDSRTRGSRAKHGGTGSRPSRSTPFTARRASGASRVCVNCGLSDANWALVARQPSIGARRSLSNGIGNVQESELTYQRSAANTHSSNVRRASERCVERAAIRARLRVRLLHRVVRRRPRRCSYCGDTGPSVTRCSTRQLPRAVWTSAS
jgi:hypothetical protein